MRTRFFTVILVFLVNCQHEGRLKEVPIASALVANCSLPTYEIESINTNNLIRIDSVRLESMRIKLGSKRNKLPSYSQYEDLFLIDTTYCDGVKITSILYKDESCCKTIFFTAMKEGASVLADCIQVAQVGSDGEWQQVESMREGRNKLLIIRKSQIQIYNNITGQYDSVATTTINYTLELLTNALFRRQTKDSSTVVSSIKPS